LTPNLCWEDVTSGPTHCGSKGHEGLDEYGRLRRDVSAAHDFSALQDFQNVLQFFHFFFLASD